MRVITVHQCSQSSVAGAVHDDGLAALIDVVIQAEKGSHSVNQHPMIGRHLRELEELRSEANKHSLE